MIIIISIFEVYKIVGDGRDRPLHLILMVKYE